MDSGTSFRINSEFKRTPVSQNIVKNTFSPPAPSAAPRPPAAPSAAEAAPNKTRF
ncbi:hypothetical protein HPP92_023947 [Vanilla planifolia]|uniref:Uncharacterized protein n=1 Tax=Vanilla planifolia TaxID=51239 RepID=A0A835PIT1_VANPL|nr:hypothetical protein HPP92_023947 [Vanilla planifolia]